MGTKPLSDETLIETYKTLQAENGNLYSAAAILKVSPSAMHHRMHKFRAKFPNGIDEKVLTAQGWTYPRCIKIDAPSTKWIIGSDLHVWSGEPPDIYRAFCMVAKRLKVVGIVLNGDIIDGARISRHGTPLRSKSPKISQEIETAKRWLKMLPNAEYKCWTMGNHDIRLDNYIAANASELDDYIVSLKEHFSDWEMAYTFELNNNTEIRHRFRSGVHAAWNNTLHSGVNILTGHTHQLSVIAQRDRRGSRYGIETGTLADPHGPQFEYTEGAPSRAQMGFVVISFDETGQMMPPETCEMVRGRPIFRGDPVL